MPLKAEQAFLEILGKDCLDWALLGLLLLANHTTLAQFIEESLLLFFPCANDFFQYSTKVVVFDKIFLVQWTSALGALVHAINALFDAHLAEGMTALGNMRVFISIATNHALSEPLHNFIDTNLETINVVRLNLA